VTAIAFMAVLFRERQALRIQEVLIAPASPWQNCYVERLIGSIRRECLNHVVILNARHLKRTLTSYFDYYQRSRTHLALGKDCPTSPSGVRRREDYPDSLPGRFTSLL
jgi:putative transposase